MVVFDNSVVIRVASTMHLGVGNGIGVSCVNSTRALEENWIVTFPKARRGVGGVTWQMVLFSGAMATCPARGGGPRAGGQEQCGQATKGMWGMSWRQEAMKGVEDCEKPGVAVNRALIPGFPNDVH